MVMMKLINFPTHTLVSVSLIMIYLRVSHGQSNQQTICDKMSTSESDQWSCKVTNECQFVQKLIQLKQVRYCYQNKKICCPQSMTNRVSNNQNSKIDPVAIVKRKCSEYAKYRFRNVSVHTQFWEKPATREELDCVTQQMLISEGKEVKPKELPHMALIGYGNLPVKNIDWACGGSLISDQYILSAAHCAETGFGAVKWAALGLLRKDEISKASVDVNIFKVAQYFNHSGYNLPYYDNDISIFKLEKPIKMGPTMRPICLFTGTEIRNDEINKAEVAGWGQTQYGSETSDTLLKASISFMNNCGNSNLKNGFDKKSMICAGNDKNRKDTCQGDSGGPLHFPIEGQSCMWIEVGVTSNGPICGEMKPGVYTRVSYYIPWIQSIVWPRG